MKKKEDVENAEKKSTWKFRLIVSSPLGGKQDRPHLHQFAPISFHSFSYSKRILYLFCRNCYMFLYLSDWSNAVA